MESNETDSERFEPNPQRLRDVLGVIAELIDTADFADPIHGLYFSAEMDGNNAIEVAIYEDETNQLVSKFRLEGWVHGQLVEL